MAKDKGKKKDEDVLETKASKKSKGGGGDVLDLTGEEWDQAEERKDWGKTSGEPPVGRHKVKIEKATREEQGGTGETAGSPVFVFRTRVKGGDNDGRIVFHRAIAHPSTGNQILNMAEGLGIELKTEPNGKGGRRVVLPKEKDMADFEGQTAIIVVTERGTYKDRKQFRTVFDTDKEAGAAKKSKKEKSGLAS